MAGQKLHILFLCHANACRSQMAEAFTDKYKSDVIEAFSAGIKPATSLSANAVKVMREAGIPIADYYPKHIEDLSGLKFDYVITMCQSINDLTVIFPEGAKVISKNFDDPSTYIGTADETLDKFRAVRDQIKDYILTLPQSLEQA